jgi:hypothetical protein
MPVVRPQVARRAAGASVVIPAQHTTPVEPRATRARTEWRHASDEGWRQAQ